KEYFFDNTVIDIVYEAYDGEKGLSIILKEEGNYDLVLLDLVMPYKDGLYVLEELKRFGKKTKVIVISGLGKEEVIRKTCSYGIKYFILKPFDLKDLETRIINIFRNEDNFYYPEISLQCLTINLLHSLGIPSHIKGYKYLKEAIFMVYEDYLLATNVMKGLYQKIANKNNTTVLRVERAMRHAIEIGWNRGDYNLIEELFGNSIDFNKSKPTNLEFITTIVDKLKIDMIKNKVG
ncbi:MAG TPA: sporulation transcription factor Spo0A, partial [Bacilli bacterium]|nr:sporulation transcription factor Spo0A [Bacilli bacterium]